MKILITGASGFIGKTLTSRLRLKGHAILEVNTAKGSITDKQIFDVFKHEDIAHVFHLAAKTFVPDSWAETFNFYSVNVVGTENVLEFCREKNIPLTFVSAYIYGQPEKLPITEGHRIVPNNPYAHSKYLAEQLCEFYSRTFNLKIVIIRPFNVYGAGQDDKFLLPLIIRQFLESPMIKVKDLDPRRDFVYIEDLVDALILSMNASCSTYNIGSGSSVSVKEIIDVIADILKIRKPVVSEKSVRKNEIPDIVADISKAAREFGWTPKHSFQAGMAKVLAAYTDSRNIQ